VIRLNRRAAGAQIALALRSFPITISPLRASVGYELTRSRDTIGAASKLGNGAIDCTRPRAREVSELSGSLRSIHRCASQRRRIVV
jgi:hypothetical protein